MCRSRIAPVFALVLCGFLVGWMRPAAAQELPFTHYTTDDPTRALPANGVTAIHHDDVGFLWIALSGAGVVRYDGQEMERYRMDDGLADPNVDGFAQGADGHLWVSGYNGLSVSTRPLADYETYERVDFAQEYCGVAVLDGSVTGTAMTADADGGVWVGTVDRGLLRYRCGEGGARVDTFYATARDAAGDVEEIYALTLRSDGSLWASLNGGAMVRLEDARHAGRRADGNGDEMAEDRADHSADRHDRLEAAPGVDATVTSYFEDRRGTLWAGTYAGTVWRLDDGAWTEVDARLGHWIRGIAETPDGTLWFGSSGGGLLRIGPEEDGVLTPRHGLLSSTIYGLGVDREGNLYVGQNQGLSKLPPDHRAFEHFTATSRAGEPPALPAASVTDVLVDGERLWIGGPGGLATLAPGTPIETIRAKDGLPTNEIYAIGSDERGAVWLGLNGPTTALHLPGSAPPAVGPTETTDIQLGGQLWQATTHGFFNTYAIRELELRRSEADAARVPSTWFTGFTRVTCLVDGAWYMFGQKAGFPPTASGGAVVDDEGHVWLATDDRGVYRSRMPLYADSLDVLHARHPGEAYFGREIFAPVFEPAWTTESGAPTNAVMTMLWHAGRIWMGTTAGLYAASASLDDVRRVEGLPDPGVVALTATDDALWVGTNEGLSEVDLDREVVKRTLGQVEGLVNDETAFINSLAAGADGSVYFGSAKGLTVYRPGRDRPNEAPPKVVLRHVDYEDQAWGRNRFEADVAALTFTREQAVRYQTRLVEYDEVWSDEREVGRIRMTNLPAFLVPRPYTLEVRARNADGLWSDVPLRYAFTVAPPWFASWWFLLGALGATGGGAVVAYRRHLARERIRHEVASARAIQQNSQPTEPLRTATFEIAGACVPAYEVGGDHFDYGWIEPDRNALALLVDVEGKRMEGAFQAAVVRGVVAGVSDRADELAGAVTRLNELLYNTLRGETAVAAVLARVDVEHGRVELVNAGCEPPLVVGRQGVSQAGGAAGGAPPLGKIRSASYRSFTTKLEPGESLYVFSDGVTEAREQAGRTYRERLRERLTVRTADRIAAGCPQGPADGRRSTRQGLGEKDRADSMPALEAAEAILKDIDTFTGGRRPGDDRTILILRRYAADSSARASSASS